MRGQFCWRQDAHVYVRLRAWASVVADIRLYCSFPRFGVTYSLTRNVQLEARIVGLHIIRAILAPLASLITTTASVDLLRCALSERRCEWMLFLDGDILLTIAR